MPLNAIQANVYANLLFTHCEKWQDLLLFHLDKVFHKQNILSASPSILDLEPEDQCDSFPTLPEIKSIQDLALVLLNGNDKHEKSFELIRHHLTHAQLRELFLAMLFIGSHPETDDEFKLSSTLRRTSMITIMLGHFLNQAKCELHELIKVQCQTVVNMILNDQDATKKKEFIISEHCMSTTATLLTAINRTILHFLQHNKRVFYIMSLLSGALQQDNTLNEMEKIEILLGILSIRIVSDVINTIEYPSEYAHALAGKYLVKLFAHLLTTDADEKPNALNELPKCHQGFLRDPANRMPYVEFCKSLDPLLILKYASEKVHKSNDKPALEIGSSINPIRDELYLWTVFGEIYTNFRILKNKTLAQYTAQIASIGQVMKRQIEESVIINIAKMNSQLVEKVKNCNESTTCFLFPALSPPYTWKDVDELRLQLSQFKDIYEHFLPADKSFLLPEWLAELRIIKVLLGRYARPENRPPRDIAVSNTAPGSRSVPHSPTVQNFKDRNSKHFGLSDLCKFFSSNNKKKHPKPPVIDVPATACGQRLFN